MIRPIRIAALALLCAGSGLAAAGGAMAEDAMMPQPEAHGTMQGDAMQGHAIQTGAMKGDAMHGDAMKGDTMAGGVTKDEHGAGKRDAMQGDPTAPKAN